MSLEFFGFGNDISRIRMEIDGNYKLLKTEAIQKELYEKALQFIEERKVEDDSNIEKHQNFNNLSENLKFKLFQVLYNSFFVDTLKYLKENPFWINPAYIGFCEVLHMLYSFDEKKDIRDDVKERFFKIFGRFEVLFEDELPDKDEMDNEKLEILHKKLMQPYKISEPQFDYFFAMTLRQMPANWVDDFFEYHMGKFESKKRFVRFLSNLLYEHAKMIPEKNKFAAQNWLEDEKQESRIEGYVIKSNSVSIQSTEVNIYDPENVNFLNGDGEGGNDLDESSEIQFIKPNYECDEIELRLQPQQIRKFLSFLWRENNGSKTPFITDEDAISHLLTYGLYVPRKTLKNRIHLNLDNKKTAQLFWDTFYHFYDRNKLSQKQKQLFVDLIYHTFDNFDGRRTSKTPNNYLRDYELTWQRKFDLDEYTCFNQLK